jgi:hypothetical protein
LVGDFGVTCMRRKPMELCPKAIADRNPSATLCPGINAALKRLTLIYTISRYV